MITGSGTYYYLADGLGSTMSIVDSAGISQNAYTYDVYGTPTIVGSLANEFDFAGQQTDSSTGIQNLRARPFDPSTGGFLSRDPLAIAPDWTGHPSTYASNSRTTMIDPLGLFGWSDVKKSAKSVIEDVGSAAQAQVDAMLPGSLDQALTAIQLLDLIPLAPICAGVGLVLGSPAGAIGAYVVCLAVEQWVIGPAALVAASAQLGLSGCGAAASGSYLGFGCFELGGGFRVKKPDCKIQRRSRRVQCPVRNLEPVRCETGSGQG